MKIFQGKKRSKVPALALGMMAMVTVSIIGTIAYLTDQASAVNTFTIGQVDISLDETKVSSDGTTFDGDNDGMPDRTDKGNEYHLLPGGEYTKDPTVTVAAGSETSHIRMILTIHNASAVQAIIDDEKNGLADYADLLGGWDDTTWLYQGFTENAEENTISFEFRYKETVDGFGDNGEKQAEALKPLFEKLIVPGTLTGDELKALYGENGEFKIEVVAHAIQASGFTENAETGVTAEDSDWAAFDAQGNK